MANDLQYVLDTLVMPAALPVLREACILPALVNTDFQSVAAEQYDTIRVPLPVDMGAAQTFDPSSGTTSTDLAPGKVDIKLDTWLYKQFAMNDKEMRTAVTSGVLPRAAEASIKSLANSINASLWQLYKDVPYFCGTPNTAPSTNADVIAARKSLQRTLAPLQDRRLVVNVDAEANLIALWADFQKTGSTEALITASMGHKFGFDIFADQQAPVHTPGTFCSVTTPAVNGALSAGATTMNVDGGSASETLKIGDVFTFAGLVDATGNKYQFVVTANATASSGAITGVTFYPALPAAVADNVVITFAKPASGTTYGMNLAFNRDAFMFAARPLVGESSENSTISVATDPVSGIPLRLETWRDPSKGTRQWRFDILVGWKTLRPELACRVHG